MLRVLKLPLVFTGFLLVSSLCAEANEPEKPRQWTDQKGRSLVATLVSAGTLSVDLRRDDGSIISIPIRQLNEKGQAYIDNWRSRHPESAKELPSTPWPTTISAADNGSILLQDHNPHTHRWRYRSKHFELISNIELPENTARDIATVFEATLAVLQQAPIGIAVTPPENPYRVELYDTQKSYQDAGGTKGSGGQYLPQRNVMLLALDNLGIENQADQLRLDHENNSFILKHEVTHQILNDHAANIPVWLSEGLAEYIAAAPYRDGTYHFHRMTENLLNYVNKWRFREDPRKIPIVPLEVLMEMSFPQWRMAVAGNKPYINYNSAALLAHFFLSDHAPGTPSPVARYLSAIQDIRETDPRFRRRKSLDLQSQMLLQGRSYQELQAEIAEKWLEKNVELIFQ
ncbi:MAG: hypothetical protein AAGD22_16005 [Verrucomicrobiota bacterium]